MLLFEYGEIKQYENKLNYRANKLKFILKNVVHIRECIIIIYWKGEIIKFRCKKLINYLFLYFLVD